jgi:hypothetical protein
VDQFCAAAERVSTGTIDFARTEIDSGPEWIGLEPGTAGVDFLGQGADAFRKTRE